MSDKRVLDCVEKMIEELGKLRESGVDLSMMPKDLYDIRVKLHGLYDKQKLKIEKEDRSEVKMRDLKAIIHQLDYYKNLNESDHAQVVDALRYACANMPSNYQMEAPMYDENTEAHFDLGKGIIHKDCFSTDECQQEAETLEEKTKRLASTIISINATLESIKPLYTELDQAVIELKEIIGLNMLYVESGTHIAVQIVDEFAEKNTIWRIQKSQRYIAKLETLADRKAKAEKQAKAEEKAAKAAAKK